MMPKITVTNGVRMHEGGAFLAIRTDVKKEVASALALIGSEDGNERLFMLCFHERGMSLHMDVTVGDGFIVWCPRPPPVRSELDAVA